MRAALQLAVLVSAATLACVVLSPQFDRLTDASFAWHMVQHLALLWIVPLLAILAQPFGLFRRVVGKQYVAALVRGLRPLHAIAHPFVAFTCVVGYLWIMHFSSIYESALEHPEVHAAEHGLLLLAGTLFWLPVLAPPPLRPLGFPVRIFYLLVCMPQCALLAFALDAAREPLYPHYVQTLGRMALADQRNGAAVMWIGGSLVIFIALLATLGLWAHREGGAEPVAAQAV